MHVNEPARSRPRRFHSSIATALVRSLTIWMLFAAVPAVGQTPENPTAEDPAVAWQEAIGKFKAGDLEAAAEIFRRVTVLSPDFAGAQMMRGRSLQALGRSEDALAAAKRAFELAPGDPSARLFFARMALETQSPRDAADALDLPIDDLPSKARREAHRLRCLALWRLGAASETRAGETRAGETKEAVTRALASFPEDPEILKILGEYESRHGSEAAAESAYARARSSDPKDPGFARAHARSLIALALLPESARDGDPEVRLSLYNRAADAARDALSLIRADPKAKISAADHQLLGEALLGARRYPEALDAFGEALRHDSGRWAPRYYRGLALLALERWEEAETALADALDSERARAGEIWPHLGLAHEKQLDFAAARAAYLSAGDTEAVARVDHNKAALEEQKEIDEVTGTIKDLDAAAAGIREKLRDLKEGGAPGPR